MSAAPELVFLAGLVVVVLGAEAVLRSASRMASMLGVKPIVIGLTIVSVGTSTPELAVGITAAAEGKGSLAVGNIAGTNLVNILLILGLSAWIRALPLHGSSIRVEVPVMIFAALLLIVLSADGLLSRAEGFAMLTCAVVYTVGVVRLSKASAGGAEPPSGAQARDAATQRHWKGIARNLLLLVLGMAATVVGAGWLVSGAVAMAKSFGMSDAIVGLTIVAIGTSAPELVTTMMATYKGERDVAIGNLIGSSIYNILVILGLTCVAVPQGLSVGADILWVDLPLAAAVALICLPVFRSDRCVSRREGACFVIVYLLYLAYLLVFRTGANA